VAVLVLSVAPGLAVAFAALAVGGVPVGALIAAALVAPLGDRRVLAILGGAALLNAAAALFTGLRSDTTTAQSGPEEQEPGHLMVREDG
jgi:hypothetical protein